MYTKENNYFRFFIALVACLLVRLLPFRAPNVEPIMATAMPFGKAYGALTGFLFGFLSIIVYDAVTSTLGTWTVLTSLSYGVIGMASAYYFQNRAATRKHFVSFAVVATLFFDATTGLLTGPLFFDQPFSVALAGQIPFTLLHLAGNVAFAAILSPHIYKILVRKRQESPAKPVTSLVENFNPKII